MKIWISGGAGYVGINLRKHLQNLDCTHFNYDAVYRHDILDERNIYRTMRECDVAVHLAAQGNVSYCEHNIEEAVEVNIIGTGNVARSAKIIQIPLVFASTAAAKTAHNVYGMTKRLGELLVLKVHGVVLRFSNVYGGVGYMTRKKTAMASFVSHKREGMQAEIFGDGSATRDFIHVDDVCQAIIMAMGAPPGTYDICTGRQTSIKELADMIEVDYKMSDPRRGDIASIPGAPGGGELGWNPEISLEDGIKELVEK